MRNATGIVAGVVSSTLFLAPSAAQADTLEIRLVLNCAPGLERFSLKQGKNDHTLCVSPDILIGDANVVSVETVRHPDRVDGVLVTYDREAQARMAKTTREHIMGQLGVIVNGMMVMAPVVATPILGRGVEIAIPDDKVRNDFVARFQKGAAPI